MQVNLTSADGKAKLDVLLDGISDKIDTAIAETMKKLKWIAEVEALAGMISIPYQREPDAKNKVFSEETENGFKIIAEGDDVAFLEFGAGVHFNGAGNYPRSLPDGVFNIGGYGLHQGLNDSWSFIDENGVLQTTHGNPAGKFMWNASEKVIEEFPKILEGELGK